MFINSRKLAFSCLLFLVVFRSTKQTFTFILLFKNSLLPGMYFNILVAFFCCNSLFYCFRSVSLTVDRAWFALYDYLDPLLRMCCRFSMFLLLVSFILLLFRYIIDIFGNLSIGRCPRYRDSGISRNIDYFSSPPRLHGSVSCNSTWGNNRLSSKRLKDCKFIISKISKKDYKFTSTRFQSSRKLLQPLSS